MNYETKTCTVAVPAFNEEKSIQNTIDTLSKLPENFNIIVVNDGSSDNTKEILDKNSNSHKIKIIHHKKNKGYGSSLKTAIKNSRSHYVMTFDSDGQHRIEDAIKLFEHIVKNDLDMVVGSRGKDSHFALSRKPGKWVLSKIANVLAGTKIPDLNSGLRVFKTSNISNCLNLLSDRFSFSTTSTLVFFNLGYEVEYVPIKVLKRDGKSSVKQIRDGFGTILLILRAITLFQPLRIFLPPALFLISMGLFKSIFWDLLYLKSGIAISSLLSTMTGITLFFFGIMADQISAIRLHDLRRNNTSENFNVKHISQ